MRRRRTPVKHRSAPLSPSGAPAPQARSRGASPIRAPVRAGLKIEVQLCWALDRDGQKVHASRLDPKDRRARAPFTCLGCGEPLVPHLGQVRARHFAHHPGSTCALTAPETALHLDAKERLLALCDDAFARRRTVTVLARCPGCRRLAPRDLAAEGDAAQAEGQVGPLRADVLVLRGGRPALALEVLVTHAVDPEKEAALGAAGVPAVEIDAREEWEEEDAGEVRIVCARSLGFEPCDACSAHARADVDRTKGGEAAELAELEAYRARGFFGPVPRRAASPPSGAAEPLDHGDAPLGPADRTTLAGRFRCPECGTDALAFGDRIARHACPGCGPRPVAWRGYDGTVVELSWWRR
jgi:hypothetical protein